MLLLALLLFFCFFFTHLSHFLSVLWLQEGRKGFMVVTASFKVGFRCFYGKQEWICGDVILAQSWFDLITSSVITAEWAPRDKQIRSSINYLLAAASSVTLWENFLAWRGEWTYVIPQPWNHTPELEELCVFVWLKFSDLTLHLSGEGGWGRTWTRGAQLTISFLFMAPFHPWPSVVFSQQVYGSRSDQRARLAPPPPGRLPALSPTFPSRGDSFSGMRPGRAGRGLDVRLDGSDV